MNVGFAFAATVISTILMILSIIETIVLIWFVLSWLVFFASQTSFRFRHAGLYKVLAQLNDIFSAFMRPFLSPFRRLLRRWDTGPVDFSPLLLIIVIFMIRTFVSYLAPVILKP
jgi:uncharacterized protein YggT (Ycf19 family)